jgi:two-component system nitrogen regulation response regulator NtrX
MDIKVNFRLITSSSINLKKEVMDGNFREDLYHRINVLNIHIPELKERASDVPILVKYFFSKFGKNLSDEMIKSYDSFYSHDWPGNVRELRNLVERICILGDTSKDSVDKIINDHFNSEQDIVTNKSTNNLTLKEARDDFERNYLKQQLKKHDGNISKTADAIGMERSALHRKLSSLNIKN